VFFKYDIIFMDFGSVCAIHKHLKLNTFFRFMYGKSFGCKSNVITLENLILRSSYFVLTPCKKYLKYILTIFFYKRLNFKFST